jgi:hypothetical protein
MERFEERFEITQVRITIETNCPALTRSMNVSYEVGHDRGEIILFPCTVFI